MSDQTAQQVEFSVPVLGQLPQQRIGLRPGERQLTEEAQHLASLAQRDADDVHQERQRHQDLDAIFAAGRNAANARLLTIGTGEKAIADEHGPAVFQPPDCASRAKWQSPWRTPSG